MYMANLEKRKIITEEIFSEKIKNKDGNFRNYIFPFCLDMSNSEFSFKLNFYNCSFEENVDFSESKFEEKVWFVNSIFNKKVIFKKSIFFKNVDFSESIFYEKFNGRKIFFFGEVYFDRTVFKEMVNFSYSRFNSSAFFLKTQFYNIVNFSYVFFNKDRQIQFVSINKNYDFEKSKNKIPFLVFRAVNFSNNIEFRDIDLSRSVFQDSVLEEKVYFKECKFSKIKNRKCFYEEVAFTQDVYVDDKYFENYLNSKIVFLIVPKKYKNFNNDWNDKINLSDKIFFKNTDIKNKKIKKFFILSRDEFSDIDEEKKYLENKYLDYDFSETFSILNDIIKIYNIKNIDAYYIFKLKKYNEIKSWENIEFLSRQFKKNFSADTDWKTASEFYVGEMNARIKKLKLKKENIFYRYFLMFYGLISGFGESTSKVLFTMLTSFLVVYWVISYLQPNLGFDDSIKYIVTLFIPIFGDKSFSGLDVQWGNRATIFFIFATFWFYILWFLLVVSMQRKFQK